MLGAGAFRRGALPVQVTGAVVQHPARLLQVSQRRHKQVVIVGLEIKPCARRHQRSVALQLPRMGQAVLMLAALGAGRAEVYIHLLKAVVFIHDEKDPFNIHRRHQEVLHRQSRRSIGRLGLALGQHQHLAFQVQRNVVLFRVGGRHLRQKAALPAAQLQPHRLPPRELLRPVSPQLFRLINVIFPCRQLGACLGVISNSHLLFSAVGHFRSLELSEAKPSPRISLTFVVIKNASGSYCRISSRRRGYSVLRTAHSTTRRSAPL